MSKSSQKPTDKRRRKGHAGSRSRLKVWSTPGTGTVIDVLYERGGLRVNALDRRGIPRTVVVAP